MTRGVGLLEYCGLGYFVLNPFASGLGVRDRETGGLCCDVTRNK